VSCIDRTRRGLGPDFDVLARIGRLGLSTPLAYGGGIRNAADASAVVQSGAERVCMDALLARADEVRAISALVGAQAVIAALPCSVQGGVLRLREYKAGRDRQMSDPLRSLFSDRVISEALMIDWRHEGHPGAFDESLLDAFPVPDIPLIAFGGVSEIGQFGRLFAHPSIVAVGVGNFLSYREHSVQAIKQALDLPTLRPASYR
jgi:cyclase